MNNNEIMVTVLCAAYNHEKYIRDALEGFVMQKTSFAFEVLVHDDASTDSTAEIIREYEQKYPEIIKPIYQTENQYSKGVNRLFTFMLPRARGKYIAVCEGDDYWTSPDKLQKQVDYIESHPECALVSHLAMMSYVDRNYVTKYTDRDFSTPERCIVSAEEIIAKHTIFPTASMLFRRDYYERNRELLSSVRLFDYVGKIMLATEGTVLSGTYQKICASLGVESVLPEASSLQTLMDIIYKEIKTAKEPDMEAFLAVADELYKNGAEAIVLGCTELSLLKKKFPLGDGILDALEVLAQESVLACGKQIKPKYQQLFTPFA